MENDINRIVKVLGDNGYKIDRSAAKRAWKAFSESLSVVWATLPKNDVYLLQDVLRFSDVVLDPISTKRAKEYTAEYFDGVWKKLIKWKHFVNAKEEAMKKRKENPRCRVRITENGRAVFELGSIYENEWGG
jgi:hypothetical protein